ncbi:MAG: hypothetical protein QF443_03350, partial [Dehalococcoidia bacterium]|nr:hypothetical protein [Dehalococcoidia bacterium]
MLPSPSAVTLVETSVWTLDSFTLALGSFAFGFDVWALGASALGESDLGASALGESDLGASALGESDLGASALGESDLGASA